MDTKTRMDIIAKQFECGLQCAGCSESNITQIVSLIRQKKITAVSLFASNDGFKVYELILSIDWNEYNKQSAGHEFRAEDIIGLRPTGEMIEVETYLDDLVRKSKERQLHLSYGISFAGALRIRNPEEYCRLKKQLGFEDSVLGWLNDLGREEVDYVLDLQELKIRLRDIKDVDAQNNSHLREKKILLLKCEKIAEQLSGSEGDYNINKLVFPIEVSLTFQGQKKAAMLLGITSLNKPAHAELKQGIISALVRREGRRIEEHPGNGDKPQEPVVNPSGKDKRIPLLRIILCSVLSVLLLIGTVNQIKEFHALHVGDTVFLGTYEQDGDLSNGNEAISWTVMGVDGGKVLLLSDVCLDAMPYNNEGTDNSWTNSSLRKWLNDDFYHSAFSESERSVIRSEEITTGSLRGQEGNTYAETFDEMEVTIDKVFAPDLPEFQELTSDLNVSNVAKEVFSSNNTVYGGENFRSMFWTRPPYEEEKNFGYGYITETEKNTGYILPPSAYAMVRPAIYIDVEMYSDLQHTPKDPDN